MNPVQPDSGNVAENIRMIPLIRRSFSEDVSKVTPIVRHASFLHLLEVVNPAFQQIGIGNNEFLARYARQSCRFQSDIFHGTVQIVDDNGIPDFERFVNGDRQGGEQISQNILDGQRYGDTTDAEACDQGGDIDAKVIENKQQDN